MTHNELPWDNLAVNQVAMIPPSTPLMAGRIESISIGRPAKT
ncbi:hypothetical protein ACWKWK_03125 [Pseudoxanthomonas beigongshangi]